MPRTLTLLLSAFALTAIAGCGDDEKKSDSAATSTPAAQTGTAPAPETAPGEVVMKGIMFEPKDITVKVGDKITWKNEDPVEHNAVATSGADFKSDLFGEGGTFDYTTTKAGTIEYECTVHPGMTGTITVE